MGKLPPCKAWIAIQRINAPAHTRRCAIDCDGYCALICAGMCALMGGEGVVSTTPAGAVGTVSCILKTDSYLFKSRDWKSPSLLRTNSSSGGGLRWRLRCRG